MSPEREWTFRIHHILAAIEKIDRYTADMTFEQFAADAGSANVVRIAYEVFREK